MPQGMEGTTHEARPRNWEEVKLPNGDTCRVIYSLHDARFQRSPEELGDAQLVGLEGIWEDAGSLTSTPQGVELLMNGLGAPSPDNEYQEIVPYVRKEHIPTVFIDCYLPWKQIYQDIYKSNVFTILDTLIAFVVLTGGNIPSKKLPKEGEERKKEISRRQFNFRLSAAVAAPFLTPAAANLLSRITTDVIHAPEWRGVDEDALSRKLEKVFVHFDEEVAKLLHQADMTVLFRNLVMAEKMVRATELAHARGITKSAMVCGSRHIGIPAALTMPRERRMRMINDMLAALAKSGADPEEVKAIAQSIELVPEIVRNADDTAWDTSLYHFPSRTGE